MNDTNPRGLYNPKDEKKDAGIDPVEVVETTEPSQEAPVETTEPVNTPVDQPFAVANDDTKFTAESPEVIAYMERFPEATLEAALGSVVQEYNETLTPNTASGETEEIK